MRGRILTERALAGAGCDRSRVVKSEVSAWSVSENSRVVTRKDGIMKRMLARTVGAIVAPRAVRRGVVIGAVLFTTLLGASRARFAPEASITGVAKHQARCVR